MLRPRSVPVGSGSHIFFTVREGTKAVVKETDDAADVGGGLWDLKPKQPAKGS